MRTILQLIHQPGPGGAETVVVELVLRLRQRGWRVIPCLPGPGWITDQLTNAGVTPHIIPMRRSLSHPAALLRVMRGENVDIVHSHLLGPAFYGGLAASLLGKPAVCTFHGLSDVNDSGFRAALRFHAIRRMTDTIVLVSEPLRDSLVESGNAPAELTRVIVNGVDTSVFRPRVDRSFRKEIGIADEQFVVGAVGNLRDAKDYPTLLRAAALVKRADADVRFVICGDMTGDDYGPLLDLRAQLDVEDTIIFAGFRDDMHRAMNGFDAFVLSSKSEGFSLATIQAMASGLAVTATRCGGPEQIISNGTDGILVSVGSPEEIAAALLAIRTDAASRARLGHAAVTTVENHFSIERMVDEYESLYATFP